VLTFVVEEFNAKIPYTFLTSMLYITLRSKDPIEGYDSGGGKREVGIGMPPGSRLRPTVNSLDCRYCDANLLLLGESVSAFPAFS
jgi:hypothetical protein